VARGCGQAGCLEGREVDFNFLSEGDQVRVSVQALLKTHKNTHKQRNTLASNVSWYRFLKVLI